MCYSMNFVLRVWVDLIEHTPERDQIIRKPFLNRVQDIISNEDASSLLDHFESIPAELREEVAEAFRRRVLRLFGYVHIEWSKANAEAVQKILVNPHFRWSEDDFMEALNLISQSLNWNLLTIFPNLLEHWFKIFAGNTTEILPDICCLWYQQFLGQLNDNISSTGENDWKFVYNVFNHLSKIYPIIGKYEYIYNKLTGIAVDRVRQCQENRILKATPYVIKLEPDIFKCFFQMVTAILENSVVLADDELLRKIRYMCGCDSKIIQVPYR